VQGEPRDPGSSPWKRRSGAVRGLLEEHVPRVYRFALRLTGDRHQAEDLTQETFLRAWRGRKRLRDPDALRVWLFKIAVNLWRDRVRRARRAPRPADAPLDDCEGPSASPVEQALQREDLQRALAAIDSLPPRQREVLYLHACEQFSIAQIANVLQVSPGAVKSSLSLARKRMRRELGDLCPDPFRCE
jgi:RNA polymerase sigma-70 factor (ECF subfamily)